MNVLIWLVIGGLVGWVASMALRVSVPEKIFMNVAIGGAGAALSGWLVAPYVIVAASAPGSIRVGGVFVAFFGAIVVLAVASLFQPSAAEKIR